MLWVDGQISSSFFPVKSIAMCTSLIDMKVTCENIESNQVDFGVAVLSGLGGGHLNNLAGAALKMNKGVVVTIFYSDTDDGYLDHDESSFAKSRTLHGEGGRGSSIGTGEVIVIISHLGSKVFDLEMKWCLSKVQVIWLE